MQKVNLMVCFPIKCSLSQKGELLFLKTKQKPEHKNAKEITPPPLKGGCYFDSLKTNLEKRPQIYYLGDMQAPCKTNTGTVQSPVPLFQRYLPSSVDISSQLFPPQLCF